MHIAAMKPVSLSSADVPAELIEKERSVATLRPTKTRTAEAEGKPGSRRDRRQAVEGSVAEVPEGSRRCCNQAFVKNDKQTVEQMLKAASDHA